jgi:hypothetical protein
MSKHCSQCELRKKRAQKNSEKTSENSEISHVEGGMASESRNNDTPVVLTPELYGPLECPCNYHGSSKGMEADGALTSCVHLHCTEKIVYEIIVMDNDSSTENILKWSFVETKRNLLIKEIPLTPAGNKKVDNGLLPLSHPPIKRLAGHHHRNRCMAGKFYKLARAAQKVSTCAMRLS